MQRVSKWSLLWPILLSILIPLVVAYFVYPDHLPPGFGIFPPEFVINQPPFWLLFFVAVAAVFLLTIVFYLFPTWFGFAPVSQVEHKPAKNAAGLPWWFWVGAVVMTFFWWLMWARVTIFGSLVYYAFTPLWWGFIMVLDGLTYRFNGGKSLMSTRFKTLLISALVSVLGWTYFEYYDYFVLSNWYYPNGHMPELSHATIVVLFLVAYSTVWPSVFEWYTLLNSFPKFVARYANGPKVKLPAELMLWGSMILIALMVVWPTPLFWVMWIGPLCIVSGQLMRKNIPTPFTALANGNWSPMLIMALASLCDGFFWEMWNYGSNQPAGLPPTNPNYWVYDIPYVNVIHIYAEMPLLGYYGYLPFGILVWVVFIWAGKLIGFNTSLTLENSSVHSSIEASLPDNAMAQQAQ